jgi:hypothetical protein
MVLESIAHPRMHWATDVLLVLCPEHLDTLQTSGWTKDDLRARIQEASSRPLRALLQDEESGAGVPLSRFGPNGPTEAQLEERIPKFADPASIHIVVAGSDAGKFSAIFQGWASGPRGSEVVSRKIEEA